MHGRNPTLGLRRADRLTVPVTTSIVMNPDANTVGLEIRLNGSLVTAYSCDGRGRTLV